MNTNTVRVTSSVREVAASVVWTIESFEQKCTVAELDQSLLSPEIVIRDNAAAPGEQRFYAFRLEVNPKNSHNPDYLSVHLQSINVVNIVTFQMFLLAEDGQRVENRTATCAFTQMEVSGFDTYYALSLLDRNVDKVLFGSNLKIGCDIVILVEGSRTEPAAHASLERQAPRLAEILVDMRDAGLMTDVALVCGNARLLCHAVVLAAQSEVFRNWLRNSGRDRGEIEFTVDDTDPEVMLKVLDFIYLDRVDFDGDAEDLFVAADKYGIEGLKLESERVLVRSMTPANAATTLILLDSYGCEADTAEAASLFAARHLTEIMRTEAWLRVEDEHPAVVHSLFQTLASFQQ